MTGRIKYQCLQIAWYAALRRSPPSLHTHTHNMTAHAWFIALHPNRMNKAAHLTNRTQLNGSTGNGTAGRCAHAHTHTIPQRNKFIWFHWFSYPDALHWSLSTSSSSKHCLSLARFECLEFILIENDIDSRLLLLLCCECWRMHTDCTAMFFATNRVCLYAARIYQIYLKLNAFYLSLTSPLHCYSCAFPSSNFRFFGSTRTLVWSLQSLVLSLFRSCLSSPIHWAIRRTYIWNIYVLAQKLN